MARAAGEGRRKQVADESPGPWTEWRTHVRWRRAVRFIETYCRLPKGYGAGELVRLAPFQKDWLKAVLADGVTSAVLSCPRGQAKSTLLACLATWAVFDKDPHGGAPQVPVVATTVGQAMRSVYSVALAMIAAEPELSLRCKVFTAIGATRVYVPSTLGEMFPVASTPDGLQGLDPSLAVCDEIGFQPIEAWDSLLLASGKRPRSLVVGIGTPGFDRESALWHLRQRVLEGHTMPGFHYREYAAPDGCSIHDEKAWRIANPALAAGFMNIDALRMAAAMSPEGHFRIFRLGQWVSGVDSWLGPSGHRVWGDLKSPWQFEPGAPTWAGVDVALKRDSTAVVTIQLRPDGRWHAKARIWTPSPDEPVDVTDTMAYIRRLNMDYDLQEVSFDPRFFDVPAKMLSDEGLPMVEIPQSVERMTAACGSAYEAIQRGDLAHDGDALFEAHVLNAVPRFNAQGFTLAKAKARGKIDACIALCLAIDRAQRPTRKKRAPLAVL